MMGRGMAGGCHHLVPPASSREDTWKSGPGTGEGVEVGLQGWCSFCPTPAPTLVAPRWLGSWGGGAAESVYHGAARQGDGALVVTLRLQMLHKTPERTSEPEYKGLTARKRAQRKIQIEAKKSAWRQSWGHQGGKAPPSPPLLGAHTYLGATRLRSSHGTHSGGRTTSSPGLPASSAPPGNGEAAATTLVLSFMGVTTTSQGA